MTPDTNLIIAFGTPQLHFKIANAAVSGYILTNKVVVVSLRDVQKAFGFDLKSENRLAELLQHIVRFTAVPATLLDAVEHPILVFYEPEKWNIKALNIDCIADLLQIIIVAKNNGFLNINQLKAAKIAMQWQDYLQQNNLKDLIAASSGFNFQKNTAKKKLQAQLLELHAHDALNWTVVLPDAFFQMLSDLYGFEWAAACANPNETAKIINDLVFSRLDPVLIGQLSDQQPKRSYKSKTPKNQEHPALQAYLDSLQQLATAAGNNSNIFKRLLNATHPKNQDWPVKDNDFIDANPSAASLSSFNAALLKSFKGPQKT